MKKATLARVGFWVVITIIFLYDRKYLIEKAGLPHFMECAIVRVGLLIALATFHLNYLVPGFFERRKYLSYSAILILSIFAYVSIQQLYDIYLYNFVLGASIPKTFGGAFVYTFITTCWYLVLTVAFYLSLEWFNQRMVLRQLMTENEFLRKNGPADVDLSLNGQGTSNRQLIQLKTGTSRTEIAIEDILYVQGLKDYSIIYTPSEKMVVHGNLKSMERQLPEKGFERVHKSYLVAVNKITRRQKSRLWIDATEIPVGRTFQKALIDK
jgi:hypothetical protein